MLRHAGSLSSQSGLGAAPIHRARGDLRGLEFLAAESSLKMAEPFYAANGYFVLEHSEHSLHGGKRMSCVKMREHLVSRRGTTSRRAASG